MKEKNGDSNPEISNPCNEKKLYYTIGEVARMFEVNTSLIRYWEKKIDIIKPVKSTKGNRMYTEEDIKNFHFLYHLIKEKGMTLNGAYASLKGRKERMDYKTNILIKLKTIRKKLVNLSELLKQPE